MSQIGYMFVGAGVGAYSAAMFHLMTHAFFKALLFLAAGHRHPRARRRAGHPADGRAREGAAAHAQRVPRRRARARRDPAASPASSRRTRSSPRRSRRGAFGYCLFAACLVGRVPDRPLHVPALLHRLRRRALDVRAGAPPPTPRAGATAPFSMVWTVAVLAVLSAIGGLLQFTPFWHPLTTLARPGRAAARPTPSGTRGGDRLGLRGRCSGSPASGSPTLAYVTQDAARCRSRGHALREEVLLGRALRRDLLPARPT